MYIVTTATNFQNPIFIMSESTEDIWKDLITGRISVYAGFPKIIRLGRECSLTSETVRHQARDLGIVLQFSGIETHSAIGQGEH